MFILLRASSYPFRIDCEAPAAFSAPACLLIGDQVAAQRGEVDIYTDGGWPVEKDLPAVRVPPAAR